MTHLRSDEICSDHFVTCLQLSLLVKEFVKIVSTFGEVMDKGRVFSN